MAERNTLIKMKAKRDEEVSHLKSLREELRDRLDVLKIIPTHLGFSVYLGETIKGRASVLTELINNYLSTFSNNSLAIKFIPSDKLIFNLLKDGKELPINNLSTGQLTVLQLSSIVALRELVGAKKGVGINILVLDELFGTLDGVRRDILIETLRELSIQGNQNVLSISHTYIDNSMPVVTVSQKGGVTKITQ